MSSVLKPKSYLDKLIENQKIINQKQALLKYEELRQRNKKYYSKKIKKFSHLKETESFKYKKVGPKADNIELETKFTKTIKPTKSPKKKTKTLTKVVPFKSNVNKRIKHFKTKQQTPKIKKENIIKTKPKLVKPKLVKPKHVKIKRWSKTVIQPFNLSSMKSKNDNKTLNRVKKLDTKKNQQKSKPTSTLKRKLKTPKLFFQSKLNISKKSLVKQDKIIRNKIKDKSTKNKSTKNKIKKPEKLNINDMLNKEICNTTGDESMVSPNVIIFETESDTSEEYYYNDEFKFNPKKVNKKIGSHELIIGLKEKFNNLDDLFIEIAERVDTTDTYSFDVYHV